MNFFSRSKKLLTFLIILCVCVAIAMFFMLYEITVLDYDLSAAFLAVLILWIVLLLITIALRCVVKDAEEDLNALMKYEQEKTDKK